MKTVDYEDYYAYKFQKDYLEEKKQIVIDMIHECADIYADSDLSEDEVEALINAKQYDEAVDAYGDANREIEDVEIDEAIDEVGEQSEKLNVIKNKIDKIQDIIFEINGLVKIDNIEVSSGSVSTYLTISSNQKNKFEKKYENNFDEKGYLDEKDDDTFSVRISDHYVGGNEFVNYSHSSFEFLV